MKYPKKQFRWLVISTVLMFVSLFMMTPITYADHLSCPPPYNTSTYGNPLDLSHCDLSGAILGALNLSGADLSNADLTNAVMDDADLSDVNLSNSDLSGANLALSDLSGANLNGANLSGASLGFSNLVGVIGLTNSQLTSASVLVGTNLTGNNLANINLSGTDLSGAILINTDLTNADLSSVNLSCFRGRDCADLSGADLSNADMSDADLSDVNLSNADLSGVIWSNTTCPDGSNSNANTPETCFPPDSTPPVISANVSGTLGNNGWYVSNIDVSWTVSDDESAISSTTGCETTLIDSDTAGTTLTCEATSEGGTDSASVTIQRDTTPPTTSASVSLAANSDVTVNFNGSDDLSGLAGCDAAVTLSSEGSGQSASGVCTDNAGNVSDPATASGINIDKTDPVVSVTGVTEGATYDLNAVPTAGCDTQDALSGVATEADLSLGGGDGNGLGTFTATCDGASDNAGNTTPPVDVTYTVMADTTQTNYNPTPAPNAPKGIYTISLTFRNISAATLNNLHFEVATLTNGNLLLNADGGPAGSGAILSIPPTDLGPDEVLSPNETFTVDFEIGLAVLSAFDFFVDAFGVVVDGLTGLSTADSDGFGFEISEDQLQSKDGHQNYMPIILK